jgi:hypothetical protein
MSTWDDFKKNIMTQKNNLDSSFSDTKITSNITQMNDAISRYTARGGISSAPDSSNDPDLNTAKTIFQSMTSGVKEYTKMNKNLSVQVGNIAGNADIQSKLQSVGTLRDEINKLGKELHVVKQDLSTSQTRQENVEKPRENISFYQGFSGMIGFTKPIHKNSIPFLIGFGILLLFLSGLILRDFFLPSAGSVSIFPGYMEGDVMSLFTDSRFYSVAAGVALVFTATGILAYSGKLGTSLKK